MSIIIDEVYTSNACNNPTKTLLSVMISSLTSEFSDIAAMVLLATLDSSMMRKPFTLVVHQLVEIEIDPFCYLVDGHPTNQKFYIHELCAGNLQVSITFGIY